MSDYNETLYQRYSREAREYATQYGLDPATSVSGEWDAFRHTYVSAEMTREYGRTAAEIAGELNEQLGDVEHNQPSSDRNMDSWNNSKGRDIGESSVSRDDSAQKAYDALRRGDLIDLNSNSVDDRRYQGPNYGSFSDLLSGILGRRLISAEPQPH